MIRCENVVALSIGSQMANNEGRRLRLPHRPISAGSSKELQEKKENNRGGRSASVVTYGFSQTHGKQQNYENGDTDNFRLEVNVRKDKSRNFRHTESFDNGDVDDLFAERRKVDSRNLSRSSTTTSENTVTTRTNTDSNIFSDDENGANIHLQHVWNGEDEEKFNEVFMALDTNKDGVITFNELKDGAQLFGWNPTGTDISRYLTQMDRDGDEKVTKTEFKMYLQDLLSKLEHPVKVLEDSIDVMMRAIDTDGNGLCSKEEFKEFIQERGDSPLTDADVDELFQQFDSDGDKTTLNKTELFRLLTEGMDLLV